MWLTSNRKPEPLRNWWDLFFADDSALVAHSPDSIQALVDRFASAARQFSLHINATKTECLYQPQSLWVKCPYPQEYPSTVSH